MTEERSVGTNDGRCGWGTCAGKIDRRKITGVLCGTAQRCFLVERVCGVGKGLGPVRTGFGLVEVRMKHHMCSPTGSPADGLRVSPAFVADDNSKDQTGGM